MKIRNEYTLSDSLTQHLKEFSKEHIHQGSFDEFANRIEEGIFYYFHLINITPLPESSKSVKTRKNLESYKKIISGLIELSLNDEEEVIFSHTNFLYRELFGKDSPLNTVRCFPPTISNRKEKLRESLENLKTVCDQLIHEYQPKTGRSKKSREKILLEFSYSSLEKYGVENYRLSKSSTSAIYNLLKIILVELSINDAFGRFNHIGDRPFTKNDDGTSNTVETIIKNYIKGDKDKRK